MCLQPCLVKRCTSCWWMGRTSHGGRVSKTPRLDVKFQPPRSGFLVVFWGCETSEILEDSGFCWSFGWNYSDETRQNPALDMVFIPFHHLLGMLSQNAVSSTNIQMWYSRDLLGCHCLPTTVKTRRVTFLAVEQYHRIHVWHIYLHWVIFYGFLWSM